MTPSSNLEALAAARLALEGLSVGDAFGERFFGLPPQRAARVEAREVPKAPWRYTDDTVLGLGVFETLRRVGYIDQDELAAEFARRYDAEPNRGYGAGAHQVLGAIAEGLPWFSVSSAVFNGAGSFGNGGAMRAAPVGAYFADDVERLVVEARRSAEITHMHAEGQAGAIAAALATAFARIHRGDANKRERLLNFVADRTPSGKTRDGLSRAMRLPLETPVLDAARSLGNGAEASAQDTVPFALWCAARHLDDYEEAMWSTVSAGGDLDTNCAIVGGIVAMSAPIPAAWINAREPLAPLTA